MSDAMRAEKIAQNIAEAHKSRSKFENLIDEFKPTSVTHAYDCQKALNNIWIESGRGPVAGYKIALTSRAIQELVGVDKPVGAAIFASTIYESPAIVHLDSYIRLGIEIELAFTIGKDIPEGTVFEASSVSEFVDSAMPAFELIEDRAADYSNLDPLSLIADKIIFAVFLDERPKGGATFFSPKGIPSASNLLFPKLVITLPGATKVILILYF